MLLAEDSDQRQEAAQENVVTLIDRITQQYPHHDAVESLHQKSLLGIGNVRWSFAQLQQASIKLAASLSTVGVQRGTRVAAFLFNQAEWPLVFLATLRLGAHFVPLDPRVLSRQEDARYILDKVEARHIFVPDRTLASAVDNISTCTPSRPIFKCVVSAAKGTDLLSGWISLSQLMETAPESAPSSAHLTPNDTILLLCTSGTTSRPKVCPHTSITIATPALALADHFDITPDQPLCQHLPSFHVFSVVMTLAFWLSGATVIFPSLSFDAAASFDALGSNVRTHMPCVPAMAQAMKAYAASHDHALPAPYHIILGGASISSDVVDLCRSLGTQRITAGYGMTEGVATLIHAMGSTQPDVVDSYVCLGRAIAGARLRICRPATRDAVHREEIGELHQGGPPVISGYLGATIEDNSCCYKKDGIDWCATGDQGYMDSHGRVYLLGRYKDLIIRGGENISPTKIEQCLLKFPHISVSTYYTRPSYSRIIAMFSC
jgi:acyl-CoA synthetase (AMP-forming)/AMP-acid ligase II